MKLDCLSVVRLNCIFSHKLSKFKRGKLIWVTKMRCKIDHLVVLFPTFLLYFVVRLKTVHNDLTAYQFQLANWLLRAECAAFAHTPSAFYSFQIPANVRGTNSAWKHSESAQKVIIHELVTWMNCFSISPRYIQTSQICFILNSKEG